MNRVAQGDFEQCEMGQLLAYLFGAIIDTIQNGKTLNRLLGIFIEGKKVCHNLLYSETSVIRTPLGLKLFFRLTRCPLFRG